MSYMRTLKRGVLAAQGKLPKKKKWDKFINQTPEKRLRVPIGLVEQMKYGGNK